MKLEDVCSLGEKQKQKTYDKPRQCIKKWRHDFADQGSYSQNYAFSSSHVWIRELNTKEGWIWKNWCFWNVMLEKTLENPLDSKETKTTNPKGNIPWIFIGRTDTEGEAQILGHLKRRADSLGKTLMLGKIKGRRRGQQRMRRLDSIIDLMDMDLSKFCETVKDREAWRAAVHGVAKCQTWLSNWTTIIFHIYVITTQKSFPIWSCLRFQLDQYILPMALYRHWIHFFIPPLIYCLPSHNINYFTYTQSLQKKKKKRLLNPEKIALPLHPTNSHKSSQTTVCRRTKP